MLRLSNSQNSSIELTLKDMTSVPLIGISLNCVFEIVSTDFTSVYDEDSVIFLRLQYYDKSTSDIKCVHSVSDNNLNIKLTTDNSLIYINFSKLINSMSIYSDTLLLNINLFEKYAKQEFLIKQPKLNLLDFVVLSTASSKTEDKEDILNEIQKIKFNNQQIAEHLDGVLDDKISAALNQTESQLTSFKNEMLTQNKSHTNLIEHILEEHDQYKVELTDILEKSQVQVLDLIADKVDNFKLTDIVGKLKKQISELEREASELRREASELKREASELRREVTDLSSKNNDNEITTVIASFEKIQQSLIQKNNNELKEQVLALITQRLNEDINLTTLESMKEYISTKNYFHIGKIDIVVEKKTYAWVKILTNINFPKVSIDDSKPRKPLILESQNSLSEIFQLQVKGKSPIVFLGGVFLPKGPKSPLDFPIGHKKYEWFESELHLQFDITDFNSEQKVDFIYQNFAIADTIICNYDNVDWRHYYINNINSHVPNSNVPNSHVPNSHVPNSHVPNSNNPIPVKEKDVKNKKSESAPQTLFS